MKLLTLFVVPLASARVIGNRHQAPLESPSQAHKSPASSLPASAENIAPSIGVHFTTSYAVAAARYPNGTVQDLGKVLGDAEYIELMSRWMESYTVPSWGDDCQKILSSPSNTFETNRFKCNLRNADRRIRRLLGRPTNRDARTLSKFLVRARAAFEAELGEAITTIAPTIFNIRPEEEQDMGDALDFVGLRSARERSRYMFSGLNTAYVDSEANAAFAGLGMGLCEDWQDDRKCQSQARKNPERTVLYINFDNSSLTASAHQFSSPYKGVMYNYIANTDLGWWNLPIFEVPRAKFWTQIHEAIEKIAGSLWTPPGRIVLMGEHGGDKEFRDVVEAALWGVLEVDVGNMLQVNTVEDSLTLAARGAAELAWRHGYKTKKGSAEEVNIEL
ncbi:hypothetical protein ACN47E_005440 [Coniothyrium glycines]